MDGMNSEEKKTSRASASPKSKAAGVEKDAKEGTAKKKKAANRSKKTSTKPRRKHQRKPPVHEDAILEGQSKNDRAHAVADLALKIAASGLEATAEHAHLVNKAFWQAERLLTKAEGLRELRVHAFQIFRPDGRMMTFKDVAERFSECEWPGKMGSEDTVKTRVEFILKHAREVLKKEISHGSTHRDWRTIPIDRRDIERRVERLLGTAFRSWGMDDLEEDFDAAKARISGEVARVLHHYLSPPGWRPPRDDLRLSGYGSFAAHTLDPPDFDQFLRDGEIILEDEDVTTLIRLFKQLARTRDAIVKNEAERLLEIIQKAEGFPSNLRETAVKVIRLVQSKENLKEAKRHATATAEQLRELNAARTTIPILRNLKKAPLVEELGRQTDSILIQCPTLKLLPNKLDGQIDRALARAKKAGSQPDLAPMRELVREALAEVENAEGETAQMRAALLWIEKQVDDCERTRSAPPEGVLQSQMTALLSKADPQSPARLFRPYEVFVFAAQADLIPEKLTAKSDEIPIEFLISPPRPLETEPSILTHHPGAIGD